MKNYFNARNRLRPPLLTSGFPIVISVASSVTIVKVRAGARECLLRTQYSGGRWYRLREPTDTTQKNRVEFIAHLFGLPASAALWRLGVLFGAVAPTDGLISKSKHGAVRTRKTIASAVQSSEVDAAARSVYTAASCSCDSRAIFTKNRRRL